MENQKTESTTFLTTYFRFENLCIRRISDINTVEVLIPKQGESLPLSHQHSTYPSKERLDEYVAKLEQVSQEKYEEYLSEFYRIADRNRGLYNKVRQQRIQARA